MIQASAVISLHKSFKSEEWACAGNWSLSTYGLWAGTITLESRDDEDGEWRKVMQHTAMADRNLDSTGSTIGGHAQFRIIFKKSRKKLFYTEAQLLFSRGGKDNPRAVFRCDNLVVQP